MRAFSMRHPSPVRSSGKHLLRIDNLNSFEPAALGVFFEKTSLNFYVW